ncbi:MAG: hypothetical protein F6J93_33535 [Oscillatoria sp. SIO1A7]|nr:hypothetical protein [Oscillatoria sp. SIO1A7]
MLSTDLSSQLKKEDLRLMFDRESNTKEQLGIEIEMAVLDPETGKSNPYEGKRGIRALLEELVRSGIGKPIYKKDILVEVNIDDEAKITLEPLQEILATGKTWAETCIENWNGNLLKSPARYVEYYRIKRSGVSQAY